MCPAPTDHQRDKERRFAALYQAYYRPILAYAVRRVEAAEDAADVVADVFTTAWRRIDELPDAPADRLWLYGVAQRVVAGRRRSARRLGRLIARLRADSSTRPLSQPGPGQPADRASQGRASQGRASQGGQLGRGMPVGPGARRARPALDPGARSAPVSALGRAVPRRRGPGPRLLGQRGGDPRAPGQDPAAQRVVRHRTVRHRARWHGSVLAPSALATGMSDPRSVPAITPAQTWMNRS